MGTALQANLRFGNGVLKHYLHMSVLKYQENDFPSQKNARKLEKDPKNAISIMDRKTFKTI